MSSLSEVAEDLGKMIKFLLWTAAIGFLSSIVLLVVVVVLVLRGP